MLNRVGTPGNGGFGYGNPGFAITLSSSGISDLHNYQDHSPSYNGSGQLIGTWQPDGPGFSSFNTLDPNGTWTLFLADLSSGSQSRIDTWGLEIEAVPEPVNVALAIFGVAVALVIVCRRCRVNVTGLRRRSRVSPAGAMDAGRQHGHRAIWDFISLVTCPSKDKSHSNIQELTL